jgi:hypothetical protein
MLDYNVLVLQQIQNVFSRPIEITPHGSQPGQPMYSGRGVFVTSPMDIATEGNIIYSDQRTVLDIRRSEYPIPPDVRDQIFIPPHMSMPAVGPFEVQDVDLYHDGRLRLTLRAVMP